MSKEHSVHIRIEEVTATLYSIEHTLEQSNLQLAEAKKMLNRLSAQVEKTDAALHEHKAQLTR